MVQVTVHLPDKLAERFGDSPEAVARRVLEIVAIEEYREGRLTHRQVGEMLGLDYWETENFFVARGVPLNYGLADVEADRVSLARFLGRP